MSQTQLLELQKIKEQIFSLNINSEDLAEFFAEIMDKINPPPKTLPKHIKEGIAESLEAYKKGKYTTLNTKKELFDHFEKLSQ